jgi:hypothetical protein
MRFIQLLKAMLLLIGALVAFFQPTAAQAQAPAFTGPRIYLRNVYNQRYLWRVPLI